MKKIFVFLFHFSFSFWGFSQLPTNIIVTTKGDSIYCKIIAQSASFIKCSTNNVITNIAKTKVSKVVDLQDLYSKNDKHILSLAEIENLDLSSYEALKSHGTIPGDLINYDSEIARYHRLEGKKKEKKKRKLFEKNVTAFSYFISEGTILFNDPITVYLNKICDTLLCNQKDIRNKIHIYTLSSPIPNAFTTIDGKIFFSIGLLSRLENESQIAFILSHEISHFVKNHLFESLNIDDAIKIKGKKKDEQKIENKNTFEESVKKYFTRSKQQELEADSLGLFYYINSPYGDSSALNIFNILSYSSYPYVESPLDISVLQKNGFAFSKKLLSQIPEKELERKSSFQEGDTFSTHPNLEVRFYKAKRNFTNKKSSNSNLFGAKLFEKVREISRFELCNIHFTLNEFVPCIYYTSYLLKIYPKNEFLTSIFTKSLFILTNVGTLTEEETSNNYYLGYFKDGGNYSNYKTLFSKLDNIEKAAMFTNFAYDQYLTAPNSYIRNILKEFSQNFPTQSDLRKAMGSDSTRCSKNLSVRDSASVYAFYFPTCYRDSTYMNLFLNQVNKPDRVKPFKNSKSILVVPFVFSVNKKNKKTDYFDYKKIIKQYETEYSLIGASRKANIYTLSPFLLKENEVDRYNDYATLLKVMRFYSGNSIPSNIFNDFETESLIEKYNASHISLNGAFFVRNKAGYRIGKLLVASLCIPGGPGFLLGTYLAIRSKYTTYYTVSFYDIKSGEISYGSNFRQGDVRKLKIHGKGLRKNLIDL
jgi:hypothetical protein